MAKGEPKFDLSKTLARIKDDGERAIEESFRYVKEEFSYLCFDIFMEQLEKHGYPYQITIEWKGDTMYVYPNDEQKAYNIEFGQVAKDGLSETEPAYIFAVASSKIASAARQIANQSGLQLYVTYRLKNTNIQVDEEQY